jgi:6-phosphogluconolactonase (cycloisomerase 2 family)
MNRLFIGRSCAAYRIAVGTALSSVAACGGAGSGATGGGGQPAVYAYVASADVNNRAVAGAVYQYSIASDGSIAPLSIASVPTGVTPTAVVSDPSGRYVYVVNSGNATISQYSVGTDGSLVALSPAVVRIAGPFQFAGFSLSIDPGGQFLYVVGSPRDPPGPPTASIAQYSIQSDGTLVSLAQAYLTLSVSASGSLAIDPGGRRAYLPGATNAPGGLVSQFSINPDGTLSPLMPATVAAAQGTVAVTIAPSGQTAYVMSTCIDTACDGQIEPYTIGANGTLTPTGVVTLTGAHVNPVEMVTDGSGAYLLANAMGVDTNAGAVYQYAVESTGALAADTPASLSVASGSVAESTYRTSLYALSANAIGFASGQPPGGHIDHYVIGTGGLLTAVSTTTVAGSLPTSMTLVVAH